MTNRILKSEYSERKRTIFCCVSSFVITALMMLSTYILYDVSPFGENMVLWCDLEGQYAPFFTELYDKVMAHDSLLYSWRTGLGLPFLGNFFNYLSSPSMIFVFLLGREKIREAIALMILVKCSFSSMTFSYYLSKSQKRDGFLTAAFGPLYAMCGWFVGYYWNIMWLDAVVILPIVVLGIELLIKKKTSNVYVLSLSFSIITNYYMGYMICIFSAIYFILYLISAKSIKDIESENKIKPLYLNRITKFATSSIIAACMSAFALIPTYFNLKTSSSTEDTFPTELKFNFKFVDFLYQHLTDIAPTFRSTGDHVLPNIWCGILTIFLVILYFLCKKISIKDKITHFILLVILYFSFSVNYLDYIWHGFHFPNDIPYRFSFMYCFVLLLMAYKVITNLENVSLLKIGIATLCYIGILGIVNHFSTVFLDLTIIKSLIIFAVYLVLILLLKYAKFKDSIKVLICFAIICETLYSNSGYYTMVEKKSRYLAKEDEISEIVDYINQIEGNDNLFRVEGITANGKNDSIGFGYNGISSFTSMNNSSMVKTQRKLGIIADYNKIEYKVQTPVYNMMNSIKYIITFDDHVDLDSNIYSIKRFEKGFSLMENKFCLPIAYKVNEEIINWNLDLEDPIKVQNDWFFKATGVENVFKKIEPTNYRTDIGNVRKEKDSDNFITKENAEKDPYLTVEYKGTGNHIYYCQNGEVKNYGLTEVDNEFSIGTNVGKDKGSEYNLSVYELDLEALQKGYEILLRNSYNVKMNSSSDIKLSSGSKNDELIFTSIPYSSGWNADNNIETINVNSYLLLKPDNICSEINLTFKQKGLSTGICISTLSLLVYILIEKRNKKRAP